VRDRDPDIDIEQGAGEMRSGPSAGRAILHRRLVLLRVSDEVRQRAGRDTGPGGQDQRLLRHQGNRRKIGRGVVRRLLVDELHLGIGRLAAEQQLIPVGIGARDPRRAGHAAGTGNVFDDDLLAENVRQSGCVDTSQRVVDAARRKRHHHGHRRVGHSCA